MVIDDDTKKKIKEIQQNYNYPPGATLIKLVKEAYPDISSSKVNEFLSHDLTTQLTKVQQKKNSGGHITALVPNESWQFDIFDLSRYASQNDQYKYVFACVDVFTRKAYMEPMKNKDSPTCAEAFQEILNRSGVKPRSMLSDQDSAFLEKGALAKVAEKNNIVLNTNALRDHHALGIIDNYAKRLKTTLTKTFIDQGNSKWIDILQKIVDIGNKTKTTGLGDIAPNDALKNDNQDAIAKLNMAKNTHNNTTTDLQPDELVRKSLTNVEFAKGTDPRWTDEVFKVKGTHGQTVILEDGTKHKRNDLLKVPPGTKYVGKNPIRAQKELNKTAKEKENQEKEQAHKEKKAREEPVIRIEPVGGGASSSSAVAAPVKNKGGRPPSGKPPSEKSLALRAVFGTGQGSV